MLTKCIRTLSLALISFVATAADRSQAVAVHDPGVRTSGVDTGGMLPNLSGPERQLFVVITTMPSAIAPPQTASPANATTAHAPA